MSHKCVELTPVLHYGGFLFPAIRRAFSTTTALRPCLVFSGTYQTDAPHGGADWIEHT